MENDQDHEMFELVDSILAKHPPDKLISEIRFLGSGSVNMAYLASVGGEKLVVRLAVRRYRAGEHAKEAWCIRSALEAGIPSPKTIAVGVDGASVYMIQEFVEGAQGDDPTVDQILVWKELGKYGRLIQTIDISDFLERTDPEKFWYERKWRQYLEYGIASLAPNDELIRLGVYEANQQGEIRAIFEGLQATPFQFGLNHGDLSERNVIVRSSGQIALFDWGCASVGISPHCEIANILRWFPLDDPRFEAYLQGYGLSKREFATLHPQIKDFQLLQAFDLVRWALDQRPEEIADYVGRALCLRGEIGEKT